LQDGPNVFSDPGFAGSGGFFVDKRDVPLDRFSNSRGVVPSRSFAPPGGWSGNPGLEASFVSAKEPSWPAGTPDGYNSVVFLFGDSEEKEYGNGDIDSGS